MYDIRIDEDKWIEWIEFDSFDDNDIYDIDLEFKPLEEFILNLELNCVVDCCGTNALSFLPKDIINASENFEKANIIKDIDSLIEVISIRKENIVSCSALNQLLHHSVFIKILNHIKSVLILK